MTDKPDMTAMVPVEGSPLTERQRALVDALVAGDELSQCWEAAGYSSERGAKEACRSPSVQSALKRAGDALLAGPLRIKAIRKLEDLVTKEGVPGATAFQAAKFIIEHGDDDALGDDKPLSQMTPKELEAMIDRLQAKLDGDLIDVTPRTGA